MPHWRLLCYLGDSAEKQPSREWALLGQGWRPGVLILQATPKGKADRSGALPVSVETHFPPLLAGSSTIQKTERALPRVGPGRPTDLLPGGKGGHCSKNPM